MVTKAKSTSKTKSNGAQTTAQTTAPPAEATRFFIDPIRIREIKLTIRGVSPMIQHKWDDKAKDMMAAKQAGEGKKKLEPKDPEQCAKAATYLTQDGRYGVPVSAVKACLVGAAHKDIGVDKTVVRKSVFFYCDDPRGIIPFASFSDPVTRTDTVRLNGKTADLRYRPMFKEWQLSLYLSLQPDLISVDTFLHLFQRAGFGVGIGEWRPERNGEFGRFEIDGTMPIEVSPDVVKPVQWKEVEEVK